MNRHDKNNDSTILILNTWALYSFLFFIAISLSPFNYDYSKVGIFIWNFQITNFLKNLVLLFPLGFFLTLSQKTLKAIHIFYYIFLGIFISLSIESIQLNLILRSSQFWGVISNTVGMTIGVITAFLFKKIIINALNKANKEIKLLSSTLVLTTILLVIRLLSNEQDISLFELSVLISALGIITLLSSYYLKFNTIDIITKFSLFSLCYIAFSLLPLALKNPSLYFSSILLFCFVMVISILLFEKFSSLNILMAKVTFLTLTSIPLIIYLTIALTNIASSHLTFSLLPSDQELNLNQSVNIGVIFIELMLLFFITVQLITYSLLKVKISRKKKNIFFFFTVFIFLMLISINNDSFKTTWGSYHLYFLIISFIFVTSMLSVFFIKATIHKSSGLNNQHLNKKNLFLKMKLFISLFLFAGIINLSWLSKSEKSALLFSDDFEKGALLIPCSGNCPEITNEIASSHQYSMKAYLNKQTSKVNYRTEVSIPGNAKFEEHYWYSFDLYLPKTHVTDNVWEIVAQWHAVPDFNLGEDWRNPVLALLTTNGQWSINSIWDSKANTFESGKRTYDGQINWPLGTYEKGKWVNWVFHIKWSYDGDGLIEVWKDGKLVLSERGPNSFNDKLGPYFKFGIYKGWKINELSKGVKERTIFFDNIKIAYMIDGYDFIRQR